MNQYPVHGCLAQIKEALGKGNNLVLTAEPGAGKSTVVPLELLNEPWLGDGKILLLQPRRVAAIAVARRMSYLRDTPPGGLVGHQVRFSNNTSRKTRIEVLTEGILTRRIQSDPFLEGVNLIIFDEFHERSIHSDLCLAICREIQRDVRPDLKILVMSATMECEKISSYLNDCEIISTKGFLHPVEVTYMPSDTTNYRFAGLFDSFKKIFDSSGKTESYLVFLPGSGEINYFADRLLTTGKGHEIFPLYGSLSVEEQEKVLAPAENPRIILATNIAETSLTIDGITTVVDSGFCRKLILDDATGLEKLELSRISKASADQRSGRAGRLGPGRAFRLWSQIEHETMQEYEEPEIHRVDITSLLLELAGWGVSEPEKFAWFEAPDVDRILASQEILKNLLALDYSGRITELGKRMLQLPVSPRLARMLLFAQKSGESRQAALACAILSEKDFFINSMGGPDYNPDADLLVRLDYLNGKKELLHGLKVDKRQITRVEKVADQIYSLLDKSGSAENGKCSSETITRALLVAFPDRVCQLRPGSGNNSYKIFSGQGLRFSNNCSLSGEKFILALSVDSRLRKGSNDGKIFLAVRLPQSWLLQELKEICHEVRELSFSEQRKAVAVRKVVRLGELLISEKEDSLRPEDMERASNLMFSHAKRDLTVALNLEEPENKAFMNRLKVLLEKIPDCGFMKIDKDWFLHALKNSLAGCCSYADLHKNSLYELYFSQLPYNLKQMFEELVPEKIKVPSGSLLKIEYPDEGLPFLRVKIQEMFGLKESPAICHGKVNLVIHFLSPAGRPVQITQDLKSFWQNGYKAIVPELKGRYPKHPWPEDPARGIAFAGTKKQLERKLKKD